MDSSEGQQVHRRGALGVATEEDEPTWQAHPTLDRKPSPMLLLAQASHWPRFHG
jgi:hypothetical protein